MTCRLSIVIPSYNTRELLKKCLADLLAPVNTVEREVFVVENGSTDGSREMLAADFPSVRTILNAQNRRWAGANNQGISASRAPLLLLLNSDTELVGGALDAMVAYADEHPDIDVIGPRLLNSDGSLQPSCRSLPTPFNLFSESFFFYKLFPRSALFGRYHMSHFDHAGVREVEMISGAALLVRRTTLERVGIFDEGFHFYGEETDYFKRLKSAGGRAVFYPGAEIVHHGTRSPQARYDFFLNLHRGMMRYIRKHHHGFALTAMVTLQYVGHLLRVPLYVAGGLITLDPALMRKGWYYLRVLF